jgi:tRNA threonylcarbamoyl adenosine modification protein YeaZ
VRTLVIDSATEACSVALFEGDQPLAGAFAVIGRGHAERLVPMITQLPDKGRSARIAVSLGPGSFTGVRIGLAAARALGLAWGAEVAGYPTMAQVAAIARGGGGTPLTVCMTGGHGEWFVQDFAADGTAEGPARSQTPAEAASTAGHALVAGSQAEALVALRGTGEALPLLPDAREFPLLRTDAMIARPAPIYGRPPDARLPA